MLPSILAKQLEKGVGDYIETTFPMTNEPFDRMSHTSMPVGVVWNFSEQNYGKE